jgi:hypothetical protein
LAGTAPVSLCNPPAHSSPRTGKAVSQLHVFVTHSGKRISLDYWRDASTQGDPSVSLVIVDRRKPSPPGTGAPKVHGRSTGFTASLRRSATLASFRPAFVVLRLPQMEDRDKLNVSVLPSPPGRQSVASFVPAERKPNRRVCPHPFVTQPTHRPF